MDDFLYDELQSKALELVQQLSGKVWTDYHAHDPGITTLDILNYALTEFDYQLNFSFEQYLASVDNYFYPEAHGLFSPNDVFTTAPVTPDDYKHMVKKNIDNIHDICFTIDTDNPGYYKVMVELSSYILPHLLNDEVETIRQKISKVYHAQRNLGENLGNIQFTNYKKLSLLHLDRKAFHSYPQKLQVATDETLTGKEKNKRKSRYIHLSNYSVRHDFPACYKEKMEQSFDTYLSIFDSLLQDGKQEVNQLKEWIALNGKTPSDKIMKSNKDLLLDTFDKIYGESSDLPFLRLKNERANRLRRAHFHNLLPELSKIRFQGINLLEAETSSGIEKYLSALLGLKEHEQPVYVIENQLLNLEGSQENRDGIVSCSLSDTASEELLPIEFCLTVLIPPCEQIDLYPNFLADLTDLLRERIPAHLEFNVYLLNQQEMNKFRSYYESWRNAWEKNDTQAILWYSGILASGLIQIKNRTLK